MDAQGNVLNAASPEPGVGSSYSHGWKQLWKFFLELFLILIVYIVISIPSDLGSWGRVNPFLNFLTTVYSILILGPVGIGMAFAYLKAVRGEAPEVGDMFTPFKNYWNAVLASFLTSVIIGLGFVLLVVPGIIFACKLAFVPYLVGDRKMEAIEAIRQSWRMTNGHSWTVFLIGLLGILVLIAGLICLGVGVIVSIMWISLALASLYNSVSLKQEIPAATA